MSVSTFINNSAFSETKPCWNIRMVGDNQTFAAPPGKEGTVNYAGYIFKNLRWPGSCTIYKVNYPL